MTLDLEGLLTVLTDAKVDFVLVGGGTWDVLAPAARKIDVFGKQVLVLTLDQLIAAKRAAGRPKDLEVLAELEALREETER